MKNTRFKQMLTAIFSVVLLLCCSAGYAENIDPDSDGSRYAWAENVGWINFQPSLGSGVTVTDSAVTGYAWAENIGWISLNPTGGGVTNDGSGNLGGYAWAENAGWINFNPTGAGVTIDSTTGVFSGYAWGENIGWISFAPTSGGVKTSWRGASGDDGGAGGGDDSTCFISTAAFGSYMEPHVKVLRDFRDACLLTSRVGAAFVRLYYKYSPPAADFIAGRGALRGVARMSLLPLVGVSWMAVHFGPWATLALVALLVGLTGVTGVVAARRLRLGRDA